MRFPFTASLAVLTSVSQAIPRSGKEYIRFRPSLSVASDSLHNIHIQYAKEDFVGELQMVYGDCNLVESHERHHLIGRTEIGVGSKPTRFVWIVPDNALSGGCLHAFSGSELVGRSNPVTVVAHMRKRQTIAEVADISGPWFDGVAYMKSKNNSDAFVAAAKDKKIVIVGGGISGLMTSLLLQSVGIEKWEIMESSQRVGGRIRTKYLNNTTRDQYQYQEMGPMRFPVSIKYPDTNETLEIKDHQMVFQLGDVLNKMNGNDSNLAVKFIPWIQSNSNAPANSNGVRLPDGRIPSAAQIAADPSLMGIAQAPPNATEAKAAYAAGEKFLGFDREKMRELASNVYKAHKKALKDGVFDWSEANYLRYALGTSLNVTDFLVGAGGQAMWATLNEGTYFSATTWRTIDKGLESLPLAFMPHIQNKTTFGRKVTGLTFKNETGKIAINWRDDDDRFSLEPKSAEFDYAVVAVPFTKVRLWRRPPYSSLLTRAISTMTYATACKVALHYKTRFWEHLKAPIVGGCGFTDIPGIGSVCYPSYKINSSGPGVLLASYNFGTEADSALSLSESDHVAMAQRAMIEIHGPIAAEQYTGIYDRKCWAADEHQAGGWASPLVGQQDLFLPAFYQTEFKTIFVGEHTSYTHAWIFSALDSAVRGTVQLLLDMGLVDEAKEVVMTWMGRWISV